MRPNGSGRVRHEGAVDRPQGDARPPVRHFREALPGLQLLREQSRSVKRLLIVLNVINKFIFKMLSTFSATIK